MTLAAPNVGLTPEQVEARRLGVGGSDAAAVLGVDPYRTALDIYRMKIGEQQGDPPNAAMKRGIFLEPVARKLYAELTGRRVRRLRQKVHRDYPFMRCMVDGEILGDIRRGRGVLEIKCPGVHTFAKIEREGLPLHWICQMTHNLEVTGYGWGSYAVFSAELWRLLHFDVERDEDLARALVMKERDFWFNHVQMQVPPPVVQDTTPELMAALAKAEEAAGKGELIVRNDAEWAEAARVYLEAKEIAETGEHLKATATERLKQVMGAKGAVEGAGVRAYWSDRDGRVTFDKKALAAAKPLDRAKMLQVIADALTIVGVGPGGEDRAMSLAVIQDKIDLAALDLAQFEKRGKGYEDFRVYPLRSVGVGD